MILGLHWFQWSCVAIIVAVLCIWALMVSTARRERAFKRSFLEQFPRPWQAQCDLCAKYRETPDLIECVRPHPAEENATEHIFCCRDNNICRAGVELKFPGARQLTPED